MAIPNGPPTVTALEDVQGNSELVVLRSRIDALAAALEHVLDVLEALAESGQYVDFHVEEARRELSRPR